MFRRGNIFWAQNNETGKQESLGTKNRQEALRLLHVKNEAQREPAINLQIARAYLSASDPLMKKRNWTDVMVEMVKAISIGEGVQECRTVSFGKSTNCGFSVECGMGNLRDC